MYYAPYLSFVVVGRNDNYGGDFLHRINVFVKVLLTLCEKYELLSELIIVEWNPPQDREHLKDAISWPEIRRKCCQVRIIKVPNEIHKKLPNPANLFLFEYIGKNVGIRRAKGEYILVTNPDIIFGEELIRFLSQKKLQPDYFYRINKYDVKSLVPYDVPVEKQLEYCAKNIIRVCGYLCTYEYKFDKKIKIFKKLIRSFVSHIKQRIMNFPLPPAHINASGDFFLMHSNNWSKLRGYPELETMGKSHRIDGLMVFLAQFSGLKQKILKKPMLIYHQDHGRLEGDEKPMSLAVKEAYQRLLHERKPIIFNNENYGLGDIDLPEEVL
ncbi:MAG: hypothetical protein QW738_08430 [Nitrososphaeria archaeon]